VTRWFAAVVLAASAALAGCGAITSTTEYGLYRRAASSASLEDRLEAAAEYRKKYPEGPFADDVKAWYTRAELLYWRSKRGSAAGLTAYLRTLPAGPHGVEAAQRLADLHDKTVYGDALAKQARATNARLERATAERARVRDEVTGWVTRFLRPDAFRTRIADAPADVVVPWSLSLPRPRCTEVFEDKSTEPRSRPIDDKATDPRSRSVDDKATDPRSRSVDSARPGIARRCVKDEELPYLVVGARGAEPREASLEIVVEEDAVGRPRRFKLGGPELFLRLEEAAVVRRFDAKNSDHRVAGIARAVALVKNAFAGSSACTKKAVAPVVLDLACRGVHLTVVAGAEPGDDDTVTIVPE
jgi:hypothetical protein